MNETLTKVLSSQSYIIKPRGWEIPFESTVIHGITTAEATEYGYDLADIMDKFFSEPVDAYIAHNMHFDKNVVYNAMHWDLAYDYFEGFGKPKICSMQIGRKYCKLPKNKSPKLSELYEYCTGKKPDITSLHNSLHDTLFLCESISRGSEIRIDLIKSYENQLNENKANVATIVQETTPKAFGFQGDINIVV
jgi:DNA polymerase-3 subunit alpha